MSKYLKTTKKQTKQIYKKKKNEILKKKMMVLSSYFGRCFGKDFYLFLPSFNERFLTVHFFLFLGGSFVFLVTTGQAFGRVKFSTKGFDWVLGWRLEMISASSTFLLLDRLFFGVLKQVEFWFSDNLELFLDIMSSCLLSYFH
ncbi:hypothetical protein RhiirA4_517586 [Rhizophagus irregularis]|uniref:Uncharacterized protein n=1 Tax=Rhizophagus irregularis TaxID=588596 RepID=A0A2I1HMQ7_9GLOM|nr:hypothetical protein RhiirA4_517586 [Rhizophagus irregularis]